jgi:hypothetical protein
LIAYRIDAGDGISGNFSSEVIIGQARVSAGQGAFAESGFGQVIKGV